MAAPSVDGLPSRLQEWYDDGVEVEHTREQEQSNTKGGKNDLGVVNGWQAAGVLKRTM